MFGAKSKKELVSGIPVPANDSASCVICKCQGNEPTSGSGNFEVTVILNSPSIIAVVKAVPCHVLPNPLQPEREKSLFETKGSASNRCKRTSSNVTIPSAKPS